MIIRIAIAAVMAGLLMLAILQRVLLTIFQTLEAESFEQ